MKKPPLSFSLGIPTKHVLEWNLLPVCVWRHIFFWAVLAPPARPAKFCDETALFWIWGTLYRCTMLADELIQKNMPIKFKWMLSFRCGCLVRCQNTSCLSKRISFLRDFYTDLSWTSSFQDCSFIFWGWQVIRDSDVKPKFFFLSKED